MHYKDLAKAVSVAKGLGGCLEKPLKVDEGTYERALKSRSPEDVLAFLKDWNRRVKVDLIKLKQAIEKYELVLRKLREETIISIDLKGQIHLDNQVRPLHDVVAELFDVFSSVSDMRRNYTGASKILHVLVPEFFVMWDRTIQCAYGCRIGEDDADERYFNFLVRVQKEAKEAVQSYCNERNCTVDVAIGKIRELVYEDGFHTLPRLVDIYNYQKYTEGKDELW